MNWFRIPQFWLALSEISRLYDENGYPDRRDNIRWIRRRLALGFLVPFALPFVAAGIRKACFGGMGSLGDVDLVDPSVNDRKRVLFGKLYRLIQ